MPTESETRRAIADVPFWYHTIELAPGIETPGHFDLRPIVEKLPWPDVRGKRCLDIGTWDGFLAFELERRGAAEVVAIDIANHEQWDWPPRLRARGVEYLNCAAGPEKGIGFRVARDLLGSSVSLEELSMYDLHPDRVGSFDVVVCGSLLLHLRDPMRALTAARSVCAGSLLSTNQVDLTRSFPGLRREPLLRLDGTSDLCQWFLPNAAGHRRLIEAAGFEIDGDSGLYSIPFGSGHPDRASGGRALARSAVQRALTGGRGVPHHALLAHPEV